MSQQEQVDGGWRSLELFRNMASQTLDDLENGCDVVAFQDGDTILRQGDDGHDMFLLDTGRVRVVIARDDSEDFIIHLTAPAIFGEMALVTHAPRTASVIAEGDVRCLRMDRPHFNAVVARNPLVAVFLTEAVGRRLMEADGITSVGKYQVMGRIGKGGAATVFEALQPDLDRPVALKMLSHSLVMHEGFAEQFRREAQMVAGLQHEHVVQVLDTEQAYGTHFIVMERLTGSLLEDLINAGVRLEYESIRRILIEVLEALQFAHGRGLLHRDIKPSNIFYTSGGSAKILDFGIAVEVGHSAEGERLGTPYYMSPEQILRRQLDGRSDLYSLGIMAFEMLTGSVPFPGDTVRELMVQHLKRPTPDARDLRPSVPRDLAEFVRLATHKHPDDRFADCRAAADHLRVAEELPTVDRMSLETVAVCYHPTAAPEVRAALDALKEALTGVPGVALAWGERPRD